MRRLSRLTGLHQKGLDDLQLVGRCTRDIQQTGDTTDWMNVLPIYINLVASKILQKKQKKTSSDDILDSYKKKVEHDLAKGMGFLVLGGFG